MPGDTLAMHGKVLYVNGQPTVETYTRAADEIDAYASGMYWQCDHVPAGITAGACHPTRDNWGPIVVPAERYFVMGDNRDDSEDSRYWGFIGRDDIRGRPLFVYYSFDAGSRAAAPWLTGIRWGRIGERVH
jgi:signal peptidase I